MADRTTTYATCWKITLIDSTIYGFTDHNTDLTIASQLYKSAVGYIPSAIQSSVELSPDNMDVAGIIDDDGLSEADLLAGKFDYAKIRVFVVDYDNLAGGEVYSLISGRLGAVSLRQGEFHVELDNIAVQLQQNIGEVYSILCPADLGDTRCGYALTADSLTITSQTDRRTFADTAITQVDGYYDGGKITWLTGFNAGFTQDIKTYLQTGGAFTIYEPTPFDITVGDTANIYRGCDKTFATCKNSFSNAINFRGFPHIPGVQNLLS